MTIPESTLRATICVALKSVSKDVRKAFGDKSWQAREGAERAIAEIVMQSLARYEINRGRDDIPKAASVLLGEQTRRELLPDHDPEEAMAVVRKTVQ